MLEEKSAKLCNFNTPAGKHCFLLLPFGISSAPEVFHKTVQQIFDGIEGIGVFINDVVVWVHTKEEHDERLHEVMNQAKRQVLEFYKNKFKFGVREIIYLGERLSEEGVQPDKELILCTNRKRDFGCSV